MSKLLAKISLATLLCVAAGTGDASAQGPFAASRGFYIAGGGGASFSQSINWKIPDSASNKATFEFGWAALGSAGYGFQNGFRAEAEIAYRRNNIDKFRQLGGSGNLSSTSVMLNGFYDWSINEFPIVPYIGAGVGWSWLRASNVRRDLITCCPMVDGRDGVFAYQLIAGLNWRITPEFSAELEYRFFGTTRHSLAVESGGVASTAKGHYYDHAVLLGLRWTFVTR